jgi:aminodeoxychorismate lyase
MIVFLNGKFVPEDRARISVFDRGFLYGDGLFEVVRVCSGTPFRWKQHWQRLEQGAEFLKLKLPFSTGKMYRFADELIARNKLADSFLRLTVSRGIGPRGYSPKGADNPTVVMTLHPAAGVDPATPPVWRLLSATPRLPAGETMGQFKTCNKLAQVLARGEADAAEANEAVLLNTDGYVVEGASSNLFWIQGEQVCTPPLVSGILAGVTRVAVRELCAKLRLMFRETSVRPKDLLRAQGVFVSLSTLGIAEAISLDGRKLKRSPLIKQLSLAYWATVRKETENGSGVSRARKKVKRRSGSQAKA